MSDFLKFICRAPGCGKKFCTQKRLEIHIKSKHPELFSLLSSPDSTDLNFNNNPIENIINTQKIKAKSNILQPIKKKQSIQDKEKEEDIIEKLNIKCNINCLKNDNILFESQKKSNNNKNRILNEITDDLIFDGENKNFEDYTEINSLDLSKKNIFVFKSNKNIPFEYFTNVIKLNLSYNNIFNVDDLKYFTNVKILLLNNNKIKDISFCENLKNLEELNLHSNEIISIEKLAKCYKLKILDISNNKIENIIDTLKTFKKLKSLEQLNIKENPLIINLFAYKHYFIYKYQNLLKIDGEEINEIDKDISGRFIRENISMYENIKELTESENSNNSIEDIENKEKNKDNNIIYKIGNTIISKDMYIPYKSKNKTKNNSDNANINNVDINIEDIKKENIKLKDIVEEQKKEIDNLKLELENSNLIIKDYESIISQYKLKYGDINSDENDFNKNENIIIEDKSQKKKENKSEKEINNLKKDLEIWKKEYFDLLYKEKKDINKETEIFNDEILKINTNRIIERPKTAVSRYDNPLKEFEEKYKEISIMKSRNVFADVLEEDTDEEEENDDNDNEDGIKNRNDNNIKENLNKIKIKCENNKNDGENNNIKILKPVNIKNKKVNEFNLKYQ